MCCRGRRCSPSLGDSHRGSALPFLGYSGLDLFRKFNFAGYIWLPPGYMVATPLFMESRYHVQGMGQAGKAGAEGIAVFGGFIAASLRDFAASAAARRNGMRQDGVGGAVRRGKKGTLNNNVPDR